jgi:hypothetical protein
MYDTLRWDKLLPPGLLDIQGQRSTETVSKAFSPSSVRECSVDIVELYDSDDNEEGVEEEEEERSINMNNEYDENEKERMKVWQKVLHQYPRELTRGKESSWPAGSHCRIRTQTYHTLLHYKIRLLLKVREWLLSQWQGRSGAIQAKEIRNDADFVQREADRYDLLVGQANAKWGSKEEFTNIHRADLWKDSITPASGNSSSSSTTKETNSQGRTSARSQSVMEWLRKGNAKSQHS